tara:strand:+ start:414 stop:1718 length:1305 start_codon:yes stop_codon:yes gene_type:complete
MKLFQQMLVACAALSLIAPIGAQATDINIEEIDTYVRKSSSSKKKKLNSKLFSNELATLKQKVDSTQVQSNNFEAGSFSDTTTLDGKVIMGLGGIAGVTDLKSSLKDHLTFNTVYQMNLNTSFTGDDNLYMRLKGGEWSDEWKMKGSTYHIEAKDTADADGNIVFKVDKIWYTFPIGESVTATVGPKIENYYMLAATPSVYKPGALKAFKLGGHGAAFGASTSTGAGLKYQADNGFASSITLNSSGAASSKGLLTDEDSNKVNTMIAYTSDQYHVSATYSRQTGGWKAWEYFATTDAAASAGDSSDSYAFRAWWRPEETGTAVPSISAGYDIINFSGHTLAEEATGYMVGLNWQDTFQPDDRIGLAMGSVLSISEHVDGVVDTIEVDPMLWELYYSFRPNDSIEVTPAIFGGSDVEADHFDDILGAVVTTTFKF